ncbi:MAG: DUF2971 domain-containing protein [Pseudolabrys sp.]|nr:DUF2971 domain-containing protein [Pseudolabrys sp.]
MPIDLSPEQLKTIDIFYNYAFMRTMKALAVNQPFVHYSSADAALSMLDSEQVWMRKAATMNDFREIDYGRECLVTAYSGDAGKRLKDLLNGIFPGFMEEMEPRFDGWYPRLWSNTFLTCFSEHDPSENGLGRLSMWRAYGAFAGVAVVMNSQVFLKPSDALLAYSSPVAYLSPEEFELEFARTVGRIEQNMDFVRGLGKDTVFNNVFNMFRAACICTKHPGFKEEREWRVVYSPKIKRSARIIEDVASIRGTPQVIQKIPLKDVPEEGLVGASLKGLVRSVIVGPSQFPFEIREAFVKKLTEKGFENAEQIVSVSNIPLRNGS